MTTTTNNELNRVRALLQTGQKIFLRHSHPPGFLLRATDKNRETPWQGDYHLVYIQQGYDTATHQFKALWRRDGGCATVTHTLRSPDQVLLLDYDKLLNDGAAKLCVQVEDDANGNMHLAKISDMCRHRPGEVRIKWDPRGDEQLVSLSRVSFGYRNRRRRSAMTTATEKMKVENIKLKQIYESKEIATTDDIEVISIASSCSGEEEEEHLQQQSRETKGSSHEQQGSDNDNAATTPTTEQVCEGKGATAAVAKGTIANTREETTATDVARFLRTEESKMLSTKGSSDAAEEEGLLCLDGNDRASSQHREQGGQESPSFSPLFCERNEGITTPKQTRTTTGPFFLEDSGRSAAPSGQQIGDGALFFSGKAASPQENPAVQKGTACSSLSPRESTLIFGGWKRVVQRDRCSPTSPLPSAKDDSSDTAKGGSLCCLENNASPQKKVPVRKSAPSPSFSRGGINAVDVRQQQVIPQGSSSPTRAQFSAEEEISKADAIRKHTTSPHPRPPSNSETTMMIPQTKKTSTSSLFADPEDESDNEATDDSSEEKSVVSSVCSSEKRGTVVGGYDTQENSSTTSSLPLGDTISEVDINSLRSARSTRLRKRATRETEGTGSPPPPSEGTPAARKRRRATPLKNPTSSDGGRLPKGGNSIALHGFCRSIPEMRDDPHQMIKTVQTMLDKTMECEKNSIEFRETLVDANMLLQEILFNLNERTTYVETADSTSRTNLPTGRCPKKSEGNKNHIVRLAKTFRLTRDQIDELLTRRLGVQDGHYSIDDAIGEIMKMENTEGKATLEEDEYNEEEGDPRRNAENIDEGAQETQRLDLVGSRVRTVLEDGQEYEGTISTVHYRVTYDDGDTAMLVSEAEAFENLACNGRYLNSGPSSGGEEMRCSMLELFSGCSLLSTLCKRRGMNVMSIDNDIHSNATVKADFSSNYVQHVLSSQTFEYIHASPVCSTYSVAAEGKHRDSHDYNKTVASHTADAMLMELYFFIAKALEIDRSTTVTIENPRGWMRKGNIMKKLFEGDLGFQRFEINYCQFGRADQKHTNFWTNDKTLGNILESIGGKCNCPLPHEEGVRKTNDKHFAALPLKLCQVIASYVQSKHTLLNFAKVRKIRGAGMNIQGVTTSM